MISRANQAYAWVSTVSEITEWHFLFYHIESILEISMIMSVDYNYQWFEDAEPQASWIT